MDRKLRPWELGGRMAHAGSLESFLTARPAVSAVCYQQNNTPAPPTNRKRELMSSRTPILPERIPQTPTGRYRCNTCAYITNDFMNYITHKNGHAGNDKKEMSLFTCGMCDFSTPTPERMVHHIECHLKPLPGLPQQASDTATRRDNVTDKRLIELSVGEKNFIFNSKESDMAISDKVNEILQFVSSTHLPNIESQLVASHIRQIRQNNRQSTTHSMPKIPHSLVTSNLGKPRGLELASSVANHLDVSQTNAVAQQKSLTTQPCQGLNGAAGNSESVVQNLKKEHTPNPSSTMPSKPSGYYENLSATHHMVPSQTIVKQSNEGSLPMVANGREDETLNSLDQPFCLIGEVKSLCPNDSKNQSTEESQLPEARLVPTSAVDRANVESGALPPINKFKQDNKNSTQEKEETLYHHANDCNVPIANSPSVVSLPKSEQKGLTTSSVVSCQPMKMESDNDNKNSICATSRNKKLKAFKTSHQQKDDVGKQYRTLIRTSTKVVNRKKKHVSSSLKGTKKVPKALEGRKPRKRVKSQSKVQMPFTETGETLPPSSKPHLANEQQTEKEMQKIKEELINYLQLRRVKPILPTNRIKAESISESHTDLSVMPECSQCDPMELNQLCNHWQQVHTYSCAEPVHVKFYSDRYCTVTTIKSTETVILEQRPSLTDDCSQSEGACSSVSIPITAEPPLVIHDQKISSDASTPIFLSSLEMVSKKMEDTPNQSSTPKRGVLKRLLPDLQQLENACDIPTKSQKVEVCQDALNLFANEQENILLQPNSTTSKKPFKNLGDLSIQLVSPNKQVATLAEKALNDKSQNHHKHSCQEPSQLTKINKTADATSFPDVTDVSSNQGVVKTDIQPNDINSPADLGEKFFLKQCKVVLTRYDHDNKLFLASPITSNLPSSVQSCWKKIHITPQNVDALNRNKEHTNLRDAYKMPRISKTEALWAIRNIDLL